MTRLLWFFAVLLGACPALADSRCVVLSADTTTIIAGPMPLSAANDCSQYGGSVSLISTDDARWTAWMASQATANNLQSYNATLAAKLLQGIAITCTCSGYAYGSLNGTYSLSDDFVTTLTNLSIRAVGNRKLSGNNGPHGGSTVVLYDAAGGAHSWDSAHILEFNDAVTDYKNAMSLSNVQANGWPTSNAYTIQ